MKAIALITLVSLNNEYEEWFLSDEGVVLNAMPDSSKHRIGYVCNPVEDLVIGEIMEVVDANGKNFYTNLKITFIKDL